MNSIRLFKVIGPLLGLALLAACGDSKISSVKDSRMRGDEFTVGETLDKVKECKSTDWTSEIVNNSTIVTHTCTVKLDDALLAEAKKGEVDALKTRADLADMSVAVALSQARSGHSDAVRQAQERSTQAARRMAEVDQRIAYIAAEQRSQFLSISGTPLRRGEAPPDPAAWEARRAERLATANGEKEKLLTEIDAEKQRNQVAVDAALKGIDNASSWQEKFQQAKVETYNALLKDVEAYYKKDHTLKVKTSFRYREGANAELVDSTLFIDELAGRSTVPVYLMDPKRMREYLIHLTKSGMGMEANRLFDERFPIESVSPAEGGFRFKAKGAAT